MFIILLPGCISYYQQRPVIVQVQDAETKAPIPGAAAQITCLRTRTPQRFEDSPDRTNPSGVVYLSTEPNGEYPHLIEAIAAGYMSNSLTVTDEALQIIKPAGWSEDVHQRQPTFTVELYAEPKFGVELVLAPGFRGVIKAEVNPRDDMLLPRGMRKLSFNVSPEGNVRITGPSVALRRVSMANYVAKDADGSILTGAAEGPQVGIRWFREDKHINFFFVGTQDDFDRYRRGLPEEEKKYINQGNGRASGNPGGGGRGGRGGGRGGMGGASNGMPSTGMSMPGYIQSN
jgi:uncharacterized membrane protein YgcG